MRDIYRYPVTVPGEAIDANGHASNIWFVQWMQDAAIAHSNEVGCTQSTEARGATWVVRTHGIEYFHPAFLNDAIVVLTWVSNCRKVRSLRRYKFVRESDAAVLAEGQTDWVFVDAKTGRPRVIPEDLIRLFTLVPEGKEP